MKTLMRILVLVGIFVTFAQSVFASEILPNTGDYFIVNKASSEALQPVAASQGQNVMTYAFTKGGLQKWHLTRFIDPVTKKPTNRYNIRCAGEVTDLEMQPHPAIQDGTAILQPTKSAFTIVPKNEGFILKSAKRNGDAMYSFPVANMATEARFGPNDDSDKFVWAILPAGE